MTLAKHELKRNMLSVLIWSITICAMTLLTMLIFPSFRAQMGSITQLISSLGPFTSAFGLDEMDFTSAIGFYGTESGTMLTIGGALFAAMTGIGLLSKEENNHTAEFLLTLPISRKRVVFEKLLSLFTLVLVLNILCFGVGVLSFLLINETVSFWNLALFHAAQCMMHFEIGCICFCVSAYSRRTQIGVGLGLALLLYFISLLVNMVDVLKPLRYLTPFSYADAPTTLSKGTVDGVLIALGAGVTMLSAGCAFARYHAKDLAS